MCKFFAQIIIALFPGLTSCRYEASVCSDSQNRSLPLAGPINMTSRKHTGIINLSVACLKILSFSSRWQHGLAVIPFMRIPAYLRLLGGITLLWPPRLMKNRKWSQDFARRALFFLMNHCYVGAVVSSRNEPVRYFHSVSPRAIDSCLFAQIECRCWCNESAASVEDGSWITR